MPLGIFIISFYLLAPFLAGRILHHYPKRAEPLRRWIKINSRFLVLVYFFSVGALVSVSSSFFIEFVKPREIDGDIFNKSIYEILFLLLGSIDRSGLYLIIFTPIVVISSFVADKIFDKISQYKFYRGGYWDPTTKNENISLRLLTLVCIFQKVPDRFEVGFEVGTAFAKVVEMEISGTTPDDRLNSFVKTWNAVDEKAGWFEAVDYNYDCSTLIFKNPFPLRLKDAPEIYKDVSLCFLAGYVKGVVECVTSNAYTINELKIKDETVVFRLKEKSVASPVVGI